MSLRGATPGSEDVPWIKLDKIDDRRVLFPPPIIIMEFYVLRSFSTVYATVVKSDSNLVVNTNRGDQAASKLSSEVMIPNHGIEIINNQQNSFSCVRGDAWWVPSETSQCIQSTSPT